MRRVRGGMKAKTMATVGEVRVSAGRVTQECADLGEGGGTS